MAKQKREIKTIFVPDFNFDFINRITSSSGIHQAEDVSVKRILKGVVIGCALAIVGFIILILFFNN
jgi:hypothetical protein